jgi:hypothetical protein
MITFLTTTMITIIQIIQMWVRKRQNDCLHLQKIFLKTMCPQSRQNPKSDTLCGHFLTFTLVLSFGDFPFTL